jgi:hypothetical protein
MFARENRYPALDYIGMEFSNWSDYFDIVVMEGEPIIINPNPPEIPTHFGFMNVTYDPDEDNLTYYYTGWKETCDERFNFELGIPNTLCSAQEPTRPNNYFKFPNQGAQPNLSFNTNDWWSLDIWYDFGSSLSYFSEYYPKTAPFNWSLSEDYWETGRNATYIPNHSDIGPHNVTVWVCDEGGMCDYQVVRIMVFDYPMLQLNGSNPYDDIEYDRASIEDFYRLSAEGTTAYFTPLLGYVFRDKQEPFEAIVHHPLQILDLPLSILGIERNISLIHKYNFSRDSLCEEEYDPCPNIMKEHEINLTVEGLDLPPAKFNVSVYQCLIRVPEDLDSSYEIEIPNGYVLDTFLIIIIDSTGTGICLYNPRTDPTGNCDGAGGRPEITSDGLKLNIDFSGVSHGVYIVAQGARSESLHYNSEWGSWLGEEQSCHLGEPIVGVLTKFDTTDVDHPLIPRATSKYLLGGTNVKDNIDDVPDRSRNDIWYSFFERFCSNDRGNICDGEAVQSFKRIGPDCEPNREDDEIETCSGPANENLKVPTPMTQKPYPATGGDYCLAGVFDDCGPDSICFPVLGAIGYCYESPYSISCATDFEGTSFEETFEVPRSSGETIHDRLPANGTCNPKPACSDDKNVYDASIEAGRYFISGATCSGGANAGCNKATDDYDCWRHNGKNSITSAVADYCRTNPSTKIRESKMYNCTNSPPPAACNQVGVVDADVHRRLCEACDGDWEGGTPFELRCCGNNPGEGGYPYSSGGLKGSSDKGDAGPEVCDDYYDNSKSKQIDNDCDGDANCKDDDCEGETGPEGGYCCETPASSSTSCVDSFESYLTGDLASCESNNECKCKEITSGQGTWNNPFTVPKNRFPLKTCIAGYSSENKYIRITNYGGSATKTITLSGNNCGSAEICHNGCSPNSVTTTVSNPVIYFKNGGGDCTATITLS